MSAAKVPQRERQLQPGPQYLTNLAQLGPRPKESILAWKMRLAAISMGRQLIIDNMINNNVNDLCRILRIPPSSLSRWLKQLGLTRDMLSKVLITPNPDDIIWIDYPIQEEWLDEPDDDKDII